MNMVEPKTRPHEELTLITWSIDDKPDVPSCEVFVSFVHLFVQFVIKELVLKVYCAIHPYSFAIPSAIKLMLLIIPSIRYAG